MTPVLLLIAAASAATPAPGDLVITEIMSNPTTAVPGFVELTNTTGADLDLLGVSISGSTGTYLISDPLVLPSGGYLLVTPSTGTGLSADVLIEGAGIALGKTTGSVSVALSGVTLDAVSYSSGAGFPTPYAASITLDPAYFDAGLNDTGDWWCKAESVWSGSNKGTPGADNDNCPTPMLGVLPGDLLITELMIMPAATTDALGEWLEVLNTTDDRIDLKGMVVTDSSGASFTVTGRVRIDPGEYAVLAARDVASQNGGISQVAYGYDSAIELSDDVGGVSLSYGGVVLESVSWDDLTWPLFPGASVGLDARYADTELNDSPDFWCAAATPYGDGDLGTPGEDGGVCPLDLDGDGAGEDIDCDDGDAEVHPWAEEVCDTIDNDCDDKIDEGLTSVFYADTDGDGHGDPDAAGDFCALPDDYALTDDDCDDDSASVYPGAGEVCDGIDNDCDDKTDEGVKSTFYADADGDGYGDAASSTAACAAPSGHTTDATDCDDADAAINPGESEVCDERDNDCDGSTDEGVTGTFYADFDGDGHGDAASTTAACALPAGYAEQDGDCDDRDAESHPGAVEVCDGADNDCDGVTDPDSAADAGTWYADSDGDGYGDAASSTAACAAPSGHTGDATDCDDTDAATSPGAEEVCGDGIDNDCSGAPDDDATCDATITERFCSDGDGETRVAVPGGDQAAVSVERIGAGWIAEIAGASWIWDEPWESEPQRTQTRTFTRAISLPDDIAVERALLEVSADNTWKASFNGQMIAADFTGGTFRWPSTWWLPAHSGENTLQIQVTNTGAADATPESNPGGLLYCVTVSYTERPCQKTDWYADDDGDGFGDPGDVLSSCVQPTGYVADASDCDDDDGAVYPWAEEVCDGIDNDCTGEADDSDTDASGIPDCEEVAVVVSGGCGDRGGADVLVSAESLLTDMGLSMVLPGDLSGLSRYPAVVYHGDGCAADTSVIDALEGAVAGGSGLVVLGDSVVQGARSLAGQGDSRLLDLLWLDGVDRGEVRGSVVTADDSHPVIAGDWGRIGGLTYRASIDVAATAGTGESVLMTASGSPVVWAMEESGQRTVAILMSIHGTPARPLTDTAGQADLDALFQNAVWWALR